MKLNKLLIGIFILVVLISWGCENTNSPVSSKDNSAQAVEDLSGFSKILLPAEAVLDSAVLYVYVNVAGEQLVNVHNVLTSWDENTVTWNSFNGEYETLPVNSYNTDEIGWDSVDVSSLISGWLNGSIENNGVLLKQPVLLSPYSRYYSKEYWNDLPSYIKLYYSINSETIIEETTVIEDAYISAIRPDDNFGNSEFLFTGWINGYEKQMLLKFDIEQEIEENPGTGTPGYWKNHPDAWPVEVIEIGGVVYTKEEAIEGMMHSVGKDKTYSMFAALVSAKLNVLIGNDDSCIADEIDEADQWMAENPLGSIVKANRETWQMIEPVFLQLDLYNNGELCAPHRD